ncbi:ATP-grasp fold amidoligase family protein [Marinobacter fonticola]|uniref:ATP-grasp fold amidoligase family protein n=1 Tax=Marinobacter fonticola TaxID=2603215 RepID=UPI0011E6C7C5|nr:ATP-grasp fold amidoligase family protein [Marinobacter fonticola]
MKESIQPSGFLAHSKKVARSLLDNELFIFRDYKSIFGKEINFLAPQTFNEKIQIQKLYNKSPKMSALVDKYKARTFIEQKGYGCILNKLLAVYRDPEEIDFDELPEQFVMKCNHSWATNIVCTDKKMLDFDETRALLKSWLEINHYYKHREWAYKNIEPRIIVEEYLSGELKDYKFFCFGGEPAYIEVDTERTSTRTLDFYDLEWRHIPCRKGNKPNASRPETRPHNLEEMLEIARELSSEFNFCRIDFLVNETGFYFGEVTFYPGGGFSGFEPNSYDHEFGRRFDVSALDIPFSSRCKIGVIKFLSKMGRV